LNISFSSNKKHKAGEVLNLMQVDCEKLIWIWYQIQNLVFMPA